MVTMDQPDIERELEEIHALAKDNHRMLRAIRRGQWMGLIFKIVFWTGLVLIPFYFYQAYVAPSLPASLDLQKLINSYQAGQE